MKHILFVSTMAGSGWGGSEELWSQTALKLRAEGYRVSVSVLIRLDAKRFTELRSAGCRVERCWPLSARFRRFTEILYRNQGDFPLSRRDSAVANASLNMPWHRILDRSRPDFVVISQGDSYDGWDWMRACAVRNIRFATIAQAATESNWPNLSLANAIAPPYRAAERAYFVSNRNLQLTRLQIIDPLENAEVVRNPFNVKYGPDSITPMPDMTRIKLACVGRFDTPIKGQDLILQVMALEKWRARPIEVSLYGSGKYQSSLQKTIDMLGIENVKIAGFVNDVQSIWNDNHGLLLTSRSEGLPLAVVEAMLCGRVPIVTDVAGNTEVINHGETGFIAAGTTVAAVDAALEEAWDRRADWESIGLLAAERIRNLVPEDPAQDLAERLVNVIEKRSADQATA